jgi:hypothetical protein
MTALNNQENVDGLLRVRVIGGFGGLILNSRSSSLGTVHQITHCALRIPHHRLAGRFDKPVIAISRPSNGLTHSIAGWLRDTCEEGLYQRVKDREKSLLASVRAKEVPRQTFHSGCHPLFC